MPAHRSRLTRDSQTCGLDLRCKRIKGYGQAAGIHGARVSPHTLRHTYVLNFVRSGGDLFTLQKVLGHNSLETSRRYCELSAADVVARQRELTPLATMHLNLRLARRIPRGRWTHGDDLSASGAADPG